MAARATPPLPTARMSSLRELSPVIEQRPLDIVNPHRNVIARPDRGTGQKLSSGVWSLFVDNGIASSVCEWSGSQRN